MNTTRCPRATSCPTVSFTFTRSVIIEFPFLIMPVDRPTDGLTFAGYDGYCWSNERLSRERQVHSGHWPSFGGAIIPPGSLEAVGSTIRVVDYPQPLDSQVSEVSLFSNGASHRLPPEPRLFRFTPNRKRAAIRCSSFVSQSFSHPYKSRPIMLVRALQVVCKSVPL